MSVDMLNRVIILLAVALTSAWANAADDFAEMEKEGLKRLSVDLGRAKKLGRPEWVESTPLKILLTSDYKQMRRAVDSRFHKGKNREAVRILYALIDGGNGKPKEWAKWYLAQGLVWAKEFPFAILEYNKHELTAHTLLSLGRCYMEYDQLKTAETTFFMVFSRSSSQPAQKNVLEGRAHWSLGDISRRKGAYERAKEAYQRARRSYELASQQKGKPGWYVANMKKNMRRMKFLMKICDVGSLKVSELKAGAYTSRVDGFDGPIRVRVTIADGKITKVDITKHKESIPLDSLSEIPRRIIEKQSLSVDTITGATVTSVAVMGAVLTALEQAK